MPHKTCECRWQAFAIMLLSAKCHGRAKQGFWGDHRHHHHLEVEEKGDLSEINRWQCCTECGSSSSEKRALQPKRSSMTEPCCQDIAPPLVAYAPSGTLSAPGRRFSGHGMAKVLKCLGKETPLLDLQFYRKCCGNKNSPKHRTRSYFSMFSQKFTSLGVCENK